MRAAGAALERHAIGACLEAGGVGLEPAHRVVDVDHGGRIAGVRRLPEVERGHDHAALGQRLVHEVVAVAVAAEPGTAVELDYQREGPLAARGEDARQQGLVPVPEILHVLDVDLMAVRCHEGSFAAGADRARRLRPPRR